MNAHYSAEADATREQLINDFKVAVADAEALLKATAGQGGEALQAVAHTLRRGAVRIGHRPLRHAHPL